MISLKDYSIIIPETAGECLHHAAEELRHFIEACTHLALKITTKCEGKIFSLGETSFYNQSGFEVDRKALGDDGFIIREKDGNIYINGNTERSILYGVYDFVEVYLGVRFIAHDCTHIPQSDGIIATKIERTEIPAFPLRCYPLQSMFGQWVDPDFMARQRNYNNFTNTGKKFGGRENFIFARVQGTHNTNFFIPEKVAKRHPEFFAFEDSKAHSADEQGFFHNSMICLTNGITDEGTLDESMDESVAKCVIDEMIKDFKAQPQAKYFVFDQMDGGVRCKCARCMDAEKKYMRSGLLMRFVNVVADKVQEYADKHMNGREFYLTTLAYSYAKVAPFKENDDGTKTLIHPTCKPNKHVVVRLAAAWNSVYAVDDARQKRIDYDIFSDWSKLAEKMFFWGYDCGFDMFQKYFPSWQNIGANVKFFAKRKNIEYIFMDGCKNSEDWQCAMRSYAYCKLFWNPDLDANALLEEFKLHFFGEIAYPYINEIIKIFHERTMWATEVYDISYKMLQSYKFPQNVDLATLDKVQALAEEMLEKVEKEESEGEEKKIHLKHLAQVYVMPMFYKLVDWKWYYPQKTNEEYIALAKEWVSWCEKGGITMYHDTFSVKDFVKAGYVFPY